MSHLKLKIAENYEKIEIYEFSDAHNEYRAKDYPSAKFFDETVFIKPEKSEGVYNVLILAGDIFNLKKVGIASDILNRYCEDFDLVLYVFGNHEHYGTSILRAKEKLKEKTKSLSNLYILQNDRLSLQTKNKTFNFLGTTLWMDFDHSNENQLIANEKVNGMNGLVNVISDFRFIKNNSYGGLQPYHLYNEFKKSIDFLEEELSLIDKNEFVCVITHHAPSLLSAAVYTSDDFKNPVDQNMEAQGVLIQKDKHNIDKNDLDKYHFMYTSNLDDFIFKHQPDLWFHGHIHKKRRYFLNKTFVYSNPVRGAETNNNSVYYPDFTSALSLNIN